MSLLLPSLVVHYHVYIVIGDEKVSQLRRKHNSMFLDYLGLMHIIIIVNFVLGLNWKCKLAYWGPYQLSGCPMILRCNTYLVDLLASVKLFKSCTVCTLVFSVSYLLLILYVLSLESFHWIVSLFLLSPPFPHPHLFSFLWTKVVSCLGVEFCD